MAITGTIERAGLIGRGGAGFPTATKFRAVAATRRRPVVLVNGGEGEPTSRKDALLLERAPHLVIDGALLAAAAVGADEIVLGIKIVTGAARRAVEQAIAERHRDEPTAPRLRVLDVPNRYLAGEERALVNLANRGRAIPPAGTSRPFEKGIDGRPTLVQNVETLAHLALIHRNGPDWFRSVGTHEMPGTTLLTVGGAVARRSVYEVNVGAPFTELLRAAGGRTDEIGAVMIGGYSGTWLSPDEALGVCMERSSLASVGGNLGCGAVWVLPATACGIRETAATMRWLSMQTAGQCGPCVFGLESISNLTGELQEGTAGRGALEQLLKWASDIDGRGACRYPDGAIRLLRSALTTFAADAYDHARGHPCPGARRPITLPLPEIRNAA
jgi:NADH:ubiquinone oxidoreductase subunit F (NADH-binding)